jgi:hypothetical protein
VVHYHQGEIGFIEMALQVVEYLHHNFLDLHREEDISPEVAQLVMILEAMIGIDLVLLYVEETVRVIEIGTGIENEGLPEKEKEIVMEMKKEKVRDGRVEERAKVVERKIKPVAVVKVEKGADQGHHVLVVMKRKVDLLLENKKSKETGVWTDVCRSYFLYHFLSSFFFSLLKLQSFRNTKFTKITFSVASLSSDS